MSMVGVDSVSLYRRTHSLSRLAWSWVGSRLAPFYSHQMNTINIVLELLLLFIIIIFFSASNNDVTLKSQLVVVQGH